MREIFAALLRLHFGMLQIMLEHNSHNAIWCVDYCLHIMLQLEWYSFLLLTYICKNSSKA